MTEEFDEAMRTRYAKMSIKVEEVISDYLDKHCSNIDDKALVVSLGILFARKLLSLHYLDDIHRTEIFLNILRETKRTEFTDE